MTFGVTRHSVSSKAKFIISQIGNYCSKTTSESPSCYITCLLTCYQPPTGSVRFKALKKILLSDDGRDILKMTHSAKCTTLCLKLTEIHDKRWLEMTVSRGSKIL